MPQKFPPHMLQFYKSVVIGELHCWSIMQSVNNHYCSGEEDMTYIQWMTLKKGEPQRCDCGYFFELVPGLPYNIPN